MRKLRQATGHGSAPCVLRVLVVALNVFGDGVRDRLDPRIQP